MTALLGTLAIGVIIAWFWTHRNSHSSVTSSRLGTGGGRFSFRRRPAGTLQRINDPRLLAAILMQQLVRTGAPVTAAEKNRILALLADPLGVADPEATYATAWAQTEDNRSFSAVADDLLPALKSTLDPAARRQLVDMLGEVAGAYGEPGELQVEAIERLERQLAQPTVAV